MENENYQWVDESIKSARTIAKKHKDGAHGFENDKDPFELFKTACNDNDILSQIEWFKTFNSEWFYDNKYLSSYINNNEGNIKTWDLFCISSECKNLDDLSYDEFCELFDTVKKYTSQDNKIFGIRRLTIYLHHIRPDLFIPVTDASGKNNRTMLRDVCWDDIIKHLGLKGYSDNITTKNYLELCKKIINHDSHSNDIKPEYRIASFREHKNSEDSADMNDKGTSNMLTDIKKLLETHHNIVLHGAPGTGKTYLAKTIAKLMNATEDEINKLSTGTIKEEDIFSEIEKRFKQEGVKDCYKLVQFHPSYDYTDFVEGLRSYEKGENIGFRREDGVFKDFCKKAIKNAFQKNAVYELIDISKDDNKENRTYFSIEETKILETIKSKNIKIDTERANKFVFIIDEINRGNMSKIFGELFFSIDPGYRGIEGRVDTQYQNLIKEDGDDVFKDGFFVPENVYIIGTMNDIDRSVESMDFAFRRRFVFKEIMAEDNADWLTEGKHLGADRGQKAIDVMKVLNKAIYSEGTTHEITGLNSGYHIGPAYFAKLKEFDNDYDQLWTYCLEPLLREYVRGNARPEDDLKKLKKAYKESVF